MKFESDPFRDYQLRSGRRDERYPVLQCFVVGILMFVLICISLVGCSGKPAEASAILNEHRKIKTDLTENAMNFLKVKPGVNHCEEDELRGKKYSVGADPDGDMAESCWAYLSNYFERGPRYPDFAKVDIKGDSKEQRLKRMATLNIAAPAFAKLESILPAVQEQGRRHLKYGIPNESYATVAQALHWTFDKKLGTASKVATKQAWTQTHVNINTDMREFSSKVEVAS